MAKLLLKLLILCILVLIVNGAIRLRLPSLPPFHDDTTAQFKYDHYLKNAENYNLVFIGSSRFYRQINPRQFDGLVDPELGIRSFNLGTPAFFPPKTWLMVEELIQNPTGDLRYIICEFDLKHLAEAENLHTPRFFYPYNFKYTKLMIRAVLTEELPVWEKTSIAFYHLVSFLESHFRFACSLDLGGSSQGSRQEQNIESSLGLHGDGYYSLEEQMKHSRKAKDLKKRHKTFERNAHSLKRRTTKSQKALAKAQESDERNEVLADYLRNLAERARQQGIHITYLLPPRLGQDYRYLWPVFDALPATMRVSLAEPELYPEFYAVDGSFDVGHFNDKGAMQFTEALARRFSEISR